MQILKSASYYFGENEMEGNIGNTLKINVSQEPEKPKRGNTPL